MDAHAQGERHTDAPLALIERLDRHGHVQQCMRVHGWPVRIGRSLDADMVVDDPHLAPLHAELNLVDDAVCLTLGQTLNGAQVGGRSVPSGHTVPLDLDPHTHHRTWRMGAATWRLRLASDALAPEQPLVHHHWLGGRMPALPMWRHVLPLLLLSVLVQCFDRWLDNNPGTPVNTYVSALLGALGLTMGWALVWSFGNKLFLGRLDYKVHLKLVLVYSLAWTLLDAALPLLAFATDWPALSRVAEPLTTAVLCALIWAHLVWIMPTHRKGLLAGVVALYMTGMGLNMWLQYQRTGQYVSERYIAALPPPSWRLVDTQPVSKLIDDARGMKAGLDRLARQDDGDEDSPLLFEQR